MLQNTLLYTAKLHFLHKAKTHLLLEHTAGKLNDPPWRLRSEAKNMMELRRELDDAKKIKLFAYVVECRAVLEYQVHTFNKL